MMRRVMLVAVVALLVSGGAAWWQWGPSVFIAGIAGLIC
jgi:hypothetical protein